MAEEIKKTVIIKVDLDISAYKKELQLANSGVAVLTKQQAELRKEGKQSSAQFADNQVKLAKYSKEVSDLKRVINNATEANAEQTGSNKQLSASISVQTYELNKKSEAWKTETNEGRLAVENLLNTTEALKANKAAVADNRMNVGNYENSVSGLKQELKAAKSEMIAVAAAMGMDSKEFQIAAAKAGVVKDKIDDINTAAKATATGSDLGKFRNQLKDVGASLLDLDFAEAAERAKGLSSVVKGFTFSGMVQGGKALIATLGEMAAAMMALPIFWIAAGIAGITAAVMLWSKSTQDGTQNVVDALDKVSERYSILYDGQIRLAKAAGKETEKLELDKLKVQANAIDKQIFMLEKLKDSYVGLNDDQKKQFEELKNKHTKNIYEISAVIVEGYKKQSEASKKQAEEDLKSVQKYADEKAKIDAKAVEDNKKRNEERIADNKMLLSKIQDANIASTADGEAKDIAREALSHLRELQSITESKANNDVKHTAIEAQTAQHEKNIQDIKDKYIGVADEVEKKRVQESGKEWVKELEAKEKLEADKAKVEQDAADKSIELAKIRATEIKKIEDAGISAMKEGITAVFTIKNNQREQEITGIETEMNAKINALQSQADAGIITQAEFETKSNRIKLDAATKEKEIKLKTWNANKRASEIAIGIKTAEAIITAYTGDPFSANALAIIAALVGATELAVVESAKPPAFAKSGLTGKRITSSDGQSIVRGNGDNLLATVKTGEVILNEQHQAALGGANTFRAIGVPGFAGGGFTDGGAMATRLSSSIDQTINSINTQRRLNRTLPPPVVVVSDIINGVDTHVKVVSRGDI